MGTIFISLFSTERIFKFVQLKKRNMKKSSRKANMFAKTHKKNWANNIQNFKLDLLQTI